MNPRLKGTLLMAALAGTFLAVLAVTPALAWWMGGSMGPGMGGGPMCRMMNGVPQTVNPAILPDPDSPGARILRNQCTQCHGLVPPGQYTARQWPAIVERMNRRMGMMSRRGMGMGMMGGAIQALTPREKAVLIAYLQAHSPQAMPRNAFPEASQPGAKSFAEICSRCHALPDPSAHTFSQWPAVVDRMEQHMQNSGMGTLTAVRKNAILNYLKENARR